MIMELERLKNKMCELLYPDEHGGEPCDIYREAVLRCVELIEEEMERMDAEIDEFYWANNEEEDLAFSSNCPRCGRNG
jgi:hypothetical protein